MPKPANQFFPPEIEALQAVARTILDNFGRKVPSRMEELLTVPERFVGKTANVLLGHAFGQPGLVADAMFAASH